MRRRYAKYFGPVVLCIFLMASTVVFGQERRYAGGAYKGSSQYQERYGTLTAGINSDIIPGNSNYRGYEYYRNRSTYRSSLKDSKKSRKSQPGKKKRTPKNVTKKYGYYKVKKGDTLFGISRKTGVSVSELTRLNKLGSGKKIYYGKRLKIPFNGVKKKVSRKKTVKGKSVSSSGLKFRWPMKNVRRCTRDGASGVKSIGVVITTTRKGERVRASEGGTVRRVGYMRGYGNYIVIKHRKNYITVYSNLGKITVREGDRVDRGVMIGSIADDRTLHFQIDRNGKARNPLALLPPRR